MRLAFGFVSLLLVGCAEPCTSDVGCSAPLICGNEGRCVSPGQGVDGAACTGDDLCIGRACVAGRCATACAGASDCPSGRCALVSTQPLRFTCSAAAGDRYYAEACGADDDCRTGLCHAGHCSAACGVCPEDFRCQPATLTRSGRELDHGVCTWWPVQPVVELGGADTTEQASTRLSFELPPGFGAFTLVLEDFGDRVPGVTKLTGPDGTVYVGNPRPPDAGSIDLARVASGSGTATVLVPGSDLPGAVARAGRYELEVVTWDPAGFPLTPRQVAGRIERVAAVLKRPVRGGQIDLNLQLAPELNYSVADGGGTWVRALLDSLEATTRARLGVSLGQVQLQLLPRDAGVRITTNAQSRALQGAHSSDIAAARPINVLVVQQLTFAGGLAGGTPGAPGVYGRPGSGITLEPLGSGPQPTGLLLAHEVLHFMGLFHTSDGFLGPDLISDTPSCVDPSATGCPDARNLMFPFFPAREPLSLSRGQAKVLEGSPWAYRRLHPGACDGHEVVGLSRFISGTTAGGPGTLAGTCGGASGAEQVHLLRLEAPATRLQATVTGAGFSPVLYLRRADCGVAGVELGCAVSDGGVASVGVDAPAAGAWFLVVDSAGDGGTFALEVTVTP